MLLNKISISTNMKWKAINALNVNQYNIWNSIQNK